MRTEYLIKLAAEDGLCIDATMTAVAPPCGPGPGLRQTPSAMPVSGRPSSGPGPCRTSAGRVGARPLLRHVREVRRSHRPPRKDAGRCGGHRRRAEPDLPGNHGQPGIGGSQKLAADVGWDRTSPPCTASCSPGPARTAGHRCQKEADASDTEFRETARCASDKPGPACQVTVRWISQVSRNSAPERVFTQIALGLRLAERDQRFVAVNLVQPEDGEISLRDYRLQMRMLDYLHTVYPAPTSPCTPVSWSPAW
ncbi:hypothetical protein NKH18_28135 [Streptomyces sp. M10(2022)]